MLIVVPNSEYKAVNNIYRNSIIQSMYYTQYATGRHSLKIVSFMEYNFVNIYLYIF